MNQLCPVSLDMNFSVIFQSYLKTLKHFIDIQKNVQGNYLETGEVYHILKYAILYAYPHL